MSHEELEAHVRSLNAKLDGKAKSMLDEIEKIHVRPLARKSYLCAASCYDKAGKTGSSDQIQHCIQTCQMPFQQAQSYINSEIQQFQDRLTRGMMQCNDEARDAMYSTSGNSNSSNNNNNNEAVAKCFTTCVDKHIQVLDTMKSRIITQIKQL